MGMIEGGAVSGVLPETEGFAVHYPAYPSSTARAVETLGGMDEIVKRRSSKDRYLELRFRPEDPDCHPAFGDLRSGCGLLLRISKKKDGSVDGDVQPSETPCKESVDTPQLCADVVARVRQAYHFEGMADYQYVLPVHAAKLRKKKRDRSDMESRFEKGRLLDLEEDDVMMLVPPLFSPKDIPEQIVLKPTPNLVSKQLQKGVVEQRWEERSLLFSSYTGFQETRSILDELNLKDHSEEFFKVADSGCKISPNNFQVDWECHILRNSLEWQYQSAVSGLFDERPVWPRSSLHERLMDDGQHASNHQMRRLLARSGYYFSTGPFGKFWIRKGYDPRKDPESRIYQRVDFRIPEPLRKVLISDAKSRIMPKWRDLCTFRALPTKVFTTLQLYELEDDYIQEEMTKPARKKTCTHSTGWLSRHMLEILMLRVRVRFLSISDNDISRNFLKSSNRLLEKNKRLLLMGDVETDDENSDAHHGCEKVKSSDTHCGTNEEDESDCELENNEAVEPSGLHPVRDGKDGADNLEVEEEDEEDGPEEIELPSVGGSERHISMNSFPYGAGENLSDDYLHDILSGLHSSRDKGKIQETDTSDCEYQIYEQESDADSFE